MILNIISQSDVKHIMTDNNDSFKCLNIHYHKYHSFSNWTLSDIRNSVCLDIQNAHYSIYIMAVYFIGGDNHRSATNKIYNTKKI